MALKDISAVVEPALAARNLELDDIAMARQGKFTVLRVTVDGDGPKGRGPSLDEIAAATRDVSTALDDSDVMGAGSYTLEVSSRGVSRPLTKPAHWRRNRGRLVAFTSDGERVTGRIVAADDTGAEVEVDGQRRRVEFADAGKAVVQVELNRPHDPDLDDDDPDEE